MKTNPPTPSFIDYFADLADPRQEDRCDHQLIDLWRADRWRSFPAAGNIEALTAAAERLLSNVIANLQAGANRENKRLSDIGLIDFEITVSGITLRLKIATKECCKGL